MIPIPAIDLKNGKVVRLFQGDFKEEKVYSDTPTQVAMRFAEAGAVRLHVVDLDGALEGKPKNLHLVESILHNVKTPVEVGGGIRSFKIAEKYFAMGASWVIFGTQACLDRGFMKEAIAEFGPRTIIGIDASKGLVATDGWTKVTEIKAIDLAEDAQSFGAKALIYTDISRDGALIGVNLKEIKAMSQSVEVDIIASGGVASLPDIQALLDLDQKNISGVIIGKALYENKFSLKDALNRCAKK
ncbi:MAG: 1-(5-phosphoribosyl)-5-[(5-phosphoribosylamino)methylideneamino]imidazole-4-carboxamide isomerase [Candidatus Omnitrophica bacterium CG07_land_8_20_14_0_80_50_8]|nr:MAG: 1-(5-phosphoribosyl)-5-[(5-phosphoribosylamino)methylideneamino]imidazole-4-carboxamide isomerase [Candidatus Omnitrophica bacterium CG07_land_8_20_14_0_80_50_8]